MKINDKSYADCYCCKHHNYCKFRAKVVKWFDSSNDFESADEGSDGPIVLKDMDCKHYNFSQEAKNSFKDELKKKEELDKEVEIKYTDKI